MGFFNWIFGGEDRLLSQLPDRVWMSRADMYREFPNELQPSSGERCLRLLVTHFPRTRDQIRETLHSTLDFREVKSPGEWSSASRPTADCPAPIVLLSADLIQGIGLPTLPTGLEMLKIFICERHFLREKDDAIVAFGERFACPGQITFHVTLDDPLLRVFASESVIAFLRSSAGDKPWLESKMVSKSIKKAQCRLQARMISNESADGPQEWLAKNVR